MDGPLAILDLLDELENVFDQPIHLCDVKPEHFGISDFGKVKFLDLDSVFLKSYLGEYSWVSNKGGLISESFSPKEKMLRTVIWHLFLRFEPKWKTFWD